MLTRVCKFFIIVVISIMVVGCDQNQANESSAEEAPQQEVQKIVASEPQVMAEQEPENTVQIDESSLVSYYVYNKEGVQLFKEIPGQSAEAIPSIISKINYQDEVKLIMLQGDEINYEGMNGKWAKVKLGNEIGYVFDGFISSLPVPVVKNSNSAYVEQLKTKNIEAKSEPYSIFENGQSQEGDVLKITSCDAKDVFLFYKDYYELPDFVKLSIRNGSGELKIVNPDQAEGVAEGGPNLWADEFTVSFDEKGSINKFNYYIRAEGGGNTISAEHRYDCHWDLENFEIVD